MAWTVTATYDLTLMSPFIAGDHVVPFYNKHWYLGVVATYRELREPDEWGDPGRLVSRELIEAILEDGRPAERDCPNGFNGHVVVRARLIRPDPLCWDDAPEFEGDCEIFELSDGV